MIYELRGSKGGAGTTTIAAALALGISPPSVLIDLGTDCPAILGIAEPAGPGAVDWLNSNGTYADVNALETTVLSQGLKLLHRGGKGTWNDRGSTRLLQAYSDTNDGRNVIVDNADSTQLNNNDDQRIKVLVTRPCYLAMKRANASKWKPDVVVMIDEPGRAFDDRDVARMLGAPVVKVAYDPGVARAIDAGLLASRMPATLVGLTGKINRAIAQRMARTA